MQGLSADEEREHHEGRNDTITRDSRRQVNLLLLLPWPFRNSADGRVEKDNQSGEHAEAMRSHAKRAETSDHQSLQRCKPNCRADKDDAGAEEGGPELPLHGCVPLWPHSEGEGQNYDIDQESDDAHRQAKPVAPTAMQHFVAVGVSTATSHGLSAQRGPG